jgi:acid phosphatase (class A)
LVDSRVMPSLADPGVNSPSYPSARAASSRVWALLLADIFPHRRESLMSMAERSAQLRLIAGVHFPSDLAAGTLVANAAYAWLQSDGDFKRSLQAAKGQSTLRRQC